jgi:hypothetical protein
MARTRGLTKRVSFYLFHKNCNKAYNALRKDISLKGNQEYQKRIYRLFLRYETRSRP